MVNRAGLLPLLTPAVVSERASGRMFRSFVLLAFVTTMMSQDRARSLAPIYLTPIVRLTVVNDSRRSVTERLMQMLVGIVNLTEQKESWRSN